MKIKRLISVLLTLVVCFTMCACGNTQPKMSYYENTEFVKLDNVFEYVDQDIDDFKNVDDLVIFTEGNVIKYNDSYYINQLVTTDVPDGKVYQYYIQNASGERIKVSDFDPLGFTDLISASDYEHRESVEETKNWFKILDNYLSDDTRSSSDYEYVDKDGNTMIIAHSISSGIYTYSIFIHYA